MFQQKYADVEGVLSAISICRGFQDWEAWIHAREANGWTVTSSSVSNNPSSKRKNFTNGVSLEKKGVRIRADLSFNPARSLGSVGVCVVHVKEPDQEVMKMVQQRVREKIGRIRPDVYGITYFSADEKLSFSSEQIWIDGEFKDITMGVRVGFDNLKIDPQLLRN